MASIETSGETLRPQTYYDRHSIWGDTFSSFEWNNQIAEEYEKEIAPLKEEVRDMLLAKTNNELEKIHLIDILERLGISYHYEKEIDENLEKIFNSIHGFEEDNEYNLYDVALLFRILRQHGFDISSEIFKKFKGSNETFKEELSNDPKGLLSLYEASFLRRHGDDILEDVLSFTKPCLKYISSKVSISLQKQIEHALVLPLHHTYERTNAYYNINFYEEDESRDEKLLKFAKLDFNLLQMLHKKELSILMKWWKPIIVKFDYARDRMVECFYNAIGEFFEPQYSGDRIMTSKSLCLFSIIDDTFDAYGKLEELKLLTNAIESWNCDKIDHQLPENMKLVYETILNLYQEYDKELRKIGRSFALDSWKRRAQEFAKAQYKEATWILGNGIPTFEEYLHIGCISITVYQMIPAFLFCSECVTKDTFEWYNANPKIAVACAMTDKSRGQLITGIECYMKQYGVSEEEAFVKFHEMEEEAMKDLNGEISRSSQVPMFAFKKILNYARCFFVWFRNDINYYVHVKGIIKSEIISLFVNPINI